MILIPVKKTVVLLLSTCLIFIGCAQTPKGEFIPYYQAETNKPYADVLAELEIAISEQNFRITGHSRVGKVIRDRGSIDYHQLEKVLEKLEGLVATNGNVFKAKFPDQDSWVYNICDPEMAKHILVTQLIIKGNC
jgi:uncharacterized protein (DUF302 family)